MLDRAARACHRVNEHGQIAKPRNSRGKKKLQEAGRASQISTENLTELGIAATMEFMHRVLHLLCLTVLAGFLAIPAPLCSQDSKGKQDQPPPPTNKLTIEVTGGDENKPIENASVYVKTVEQHLIKDKKFEVNVKTNMRGVAHVPDAPTGRLLIQVVADGWKTYGHWYDVTDLKEPIKIHLEKPPKWY